MFFAFPSVFICVFVKKSDSDTQNNGSCGNIVILLRFNVIIQVNISDFRNCVNEVLHHR